MLWVPSPGLVKIVSNIGIVGSATGGTGVPGSATTLLDGTVTELISAAANTQDSCGISIAVHDTGASSTSAEAAVDILVGGATDDVLISALLCGWARGDGGGIMGTWYFPVHIPAGVRIAARFASVRVSITASVMAALHGGTSQYGTGRRVTTYGTQVNNARGVAITPAASGGAASSTQIVASTTEDHFAFMPSFQVAADTGISVQGFVNIGIGVGADPPDRIGTWVWHKHGGEGLSGPFPATPAYAKVPAGSRLTILSSAPGANDAAQDALIHAVS